ncbi:MAG: tRNA lysidine(34) synthetase TilS [Candidatus Paraimprobicoccus trichonymphae]|uniref:tRNA(Ile)-lysidine synthase n=1 Tax=Candidatus Paraimprobicoccus trichonymphae TaxID=3033793 RepID=A0AA48I502_9FIRM|nr:MAG: tRNA lysidine(34) synthetase TilS [Candidatus Paraimprobicoccus trichonymphae]
MLYKTDNLIIGTSGGADSMSLLNFLYDYNLKINKFNLIAVHVNHCLRNEESDRDAKFVEDFCMNKNIKLYIKKIDIKKIAKEKKIGLEECGRNVRYSIFNDFSLKYENSKIATAHTLSDSMETFFLNLIRGGNLKSLIGIPPVRKDIIRPLIFISREEIEFYCKFNNIKYVTDSSNFDRNYNRNKVRLDIVPVLKKINPSFNSIFKRFINNIFQEEEYLDNISQKIYLNTKLENQKFNIKNLKNLDVCIKKRVIFKILKDFSENIESKHVNLALKSIENNINYINLSCDIKIKLENEILELRKSKIDKKLVWKYKFNKINDLREINKIFLVKKILENFKKYDLKNLVDINKIENLKDVLFRNRRPEDIFCPINRNITKKVKKFFNELKIDKNLRNTLVFLAEKNNVIWIENIGVSEKYKIDENTKKAFFIYQTKNNVQNL